VSSERCYEKKNGKGNEGNSESEMGKANSTTQYYENLRRMALSNSVERSIKVSRGMQALMQGGMITLIECCKEFFSDEKISRSVVNETRQSKPRQRTDSQQISQEIVNVLTEIALIHVRAVL